MVGTLFKLMAAVMFVFLFCASHGFAAGVTCFIDSQGGDDLRSGLSEVEAVKSQSAVALTCTEIRYKRGSVFNEAIRLTRTAKVYTNYGDPNEPLPRFSSIR